VPVKRLLIGDIHGCYDELQALLDSGRLNSDDEIIALGDIVDRGPATPQVLEFFQTQPNARSIMGNHERKHLRSFRGETKAARSQTITRMQLGESYTSWLKFIETFPRGLELEDAIAVHGFWELGRTLAQQDDKVIIGTMGGEKIVKNACGDKWYEHYDGDKPLIVGHHDYLRNGQPFIYRDKVFCLDTSCCTGGTLTGIILPDFRIVSVPSRANYWQQAVLAYRASLPPQPIIEWTADDDLVLEKIYDAIVNRSRQLLAELKQDENFEHLTPHQRGKLFAEKVGRGDLARYIHRARLGRLTLDGLRRGLRDPEWAREITEDLEEFLG
jgi:serine/threonine protein phosphatase 1